MSRELTERTLYLILRRIQETIQKIKNETPSANLRSLVLNLDSLTDVRKAAAEVNLYAEPIHVSWDLMQ